MNSDGRLAQLDLELSMTKWDMVCFSNTRTKTQDVFVKDGHRLICSNDDEGRSPASGVAILINRCWTTSIKRKSCLHDLVIAIDFKLPRRMIRVLAVYLPNAWNYDLTYFQLIFDDIERLSMEAMIYFSNEEIDKKISLNFVSNSQWISQMGILPE